MRLDAAVEIELDIDPLWHVFLNEIRAGHRVFRRVGERQAATAAGLCQPDLLQCRPGLVNIGLDIFSRCLGRVEHADILAGGQKQGRPAGADHAGTDDGGLVEITHQNNPGLSGDAAVRPPSTTKH